jgi:flagellar protein FlbD
LILLSRLGGPDFALNPDLIERAEATPDTVVTLVSGNKYVIRQSMDELIELICQNRAEVLAAAAALGDSVILGEHRKPLRHNPRRELSGVPSVVPLHPQEG